MNKKIQLSMGVNFMYVTDKEKTRTFYVKSDSKAILVYDKIVVKGNFRKR